MTKSATFCDRCEAIVWSVPTLRIQTHPALRSRVAEHKGVVVTDLYGSQVYELCESCAVKLRTWIEGDEE